MKNINFYYILIFILALLYYCDIDNFTGYNYDAHEISQTVPIQGYILDQYTHLPVKNALVRVKNQETLGDKDGFFKLVYILDEDDQYNKPLNMNVQVEKYYDYNEKKIIMPDKNEFILYIDRASPVIDQTILFKSDIINEDSTYTYTCQVILTDYQGASSIINVTGFFAYGPGYLITISTKFKKVKDITTTTAYWESIFSLKIEKRLIHSYNIVAQDNEGYSEEYEHVAFEFNDSLLF